MQVLNKRQQQDTGKETILQCEISASPQAIVNWRKGEHVFSANNYQRITPEIYKKDIYTTVLLLRIQNLTWSDFGEYVCEASNSLGRDLETMHLYRKYQWRIQEFPNGVWFFYAPSHIPNVFAARVVNQIHNINIVY